MKTIFSFLSVCFFSITLFAQEISLELVSGGFSNPLEIQHAGDERLFVVEQGGRIKILNPETGETNSEVFLNISSIISTGGERGLLGLAFHPNYNENGYFYVYYTNLSGDTQVSRFSVSSDNPDIADPDSELQMLSFTQPYSNHNGGHIAFGPDGKLYIASGDGGSGGDPHNYSQNRNTLLGKLLRIDVDIAAPYIPSDNPFVGVPDTRDEIWAYGLRNPWKFSFDSESDDLWIADVGQGAMEEINKELYTEAGLNYGWRCYEGTLPYITGGCPPESELTFPFAEYPRSGGHCSVTGGYVYRGEEFPNFQGLYFFTDYCSRRIGTVDSEGNLTFHGTFTASSITTFGLDVHKNLYLAGSGAVYKVIDDTPVSVDDNISAGFLIYPNPASSFISIDFANEDIQQVSLYDLTGKRMLTEQASGKNHISITVDGFSKGIYVVEIVKNNGTAHFRKIVVK